MKIGHWITAVALLAVSAAAPSLAAQTAAPQGRDGSQGTMQTNASPSTESANKRMDEAEVLEDSREAGLLTDWHLEGRFGRGDGAEFSRKFAPEKVARKDAGKPDAKGFEARGFERRRYELVFPGGTFALPPELAGLKGVFYANSNTYLNGGGEWIVYLESGAETVVFVDGQRVLTRGSKAMGVLREKIHVESGYHSVMVKFTAQAAPFRVAILPPNATSRRKNNTPYLKASPTSEDMLAKSASGAGEVSAE